MGFKLKSGNKPEFKQMGSSPSAIRTMGSPFHETENEKEPKEEFNMMNNPPPDPDPDPAGPAPDPDPDPDPGTPEPDPGTEPDPEPDPDPEADPEVDKESEEKPEEQEEAEAEVQQEQEEKPVETMTPEEANLEMGKELDAGAASEEQIKDMDAYEKAEMEDAKVQELARDTIDAKVGDLKGDVKNKAAKEAYEQLAKRKLMSKAALKVAGKVALKAIPGVNLISTAYDVGKLAHNAYQNREAIKGWAQRNAGNLKNRFSEWMT